jgi:hypothetical protein
VQLSSRKTRPFKVFDFPRAGEDGAPIGQIAIITPTVKEIMMWNLQVERDLQEMYRSGGLDASSGERIAAVKQHMVMDQILSQAIRDPENLDVRPLGGIIKGGKALKPSDVLTADEMAVLYRQYEITQSSLGPIVATMSDDVFSAWMAKIERGADDDSFLASLTLGAMTDLLILLVRAWRQQMGKPSPGTSPGADDQK